MIYLVHLLFSFHLALAGLSIKSDLSVYTVYSYDNSKIILQSVGTKEKWTLNRSFWFSGQQPTIGRKVFLAGAIKKQLVPYR